MKTACIRFEPVGWEIEIYPATEENEKYVARIQALADPHQLALSIDRLPDARARAILAQVFAETVIHTSPTPGLPATPEGWHAWLIEHPDELEVLVRTAMMPEQWEAMASGDHDAHWPG